MMRELKIYIRIHNNKILSVVERNGLSKANTIFILDHLKKKIGMEKEKIVVTRVKDFFTEEEDAL